MHKQATSALLLNSQRCMQVLGGGEAQQLLTFGLLVVPLV